MRATAPVYATTTTAPKRDVWYIIFDRYGSDAALRLRYDHVNDLTPWLAERGFTVLDDSHANYGRTSLSIPSTLNLVHLDRFRGWDGPRQSRLQGRPVGDPRQRRSVASSRPSATTISTSAAGGIRRRRIRSRTSTIRLAAATAFASVLFETSALPTLTTRLGLTERRPSARTRNWENGRFEFDTLDTLVDDPSPKFVFAHILLPHPPVVFDRDGGFLDGPEADALTGRERWARQLEYTNTRIRRLVDALLALPPDRRPIIILQADEGPYPGELSARIRTDSTWADATEPTTSRRSSGS